MDGLAVAHLSTVRGCNSVHAAALEPGTNGMTGRRISFHLMEPLVGSYPS